MRSPRSCLRALLRRGAALVLALLFVQAAATMPTEPGPRRLYEDPDISFFAYEAPATGLFRRTVDGLDYAALAATARETTRRLERSLGMPPGPPMRVLLVPAAGVESEGTTLLSLPHWAAGAAFGAGGEIVLVVGRAGSYPDRDLPGVLAHECAHVVLDRALEAAPPADASRPAASGSAEGRVPRWFAEGFAVLEAHPWGWKDALQLASTVVWERPPSLASLSKEFPIGQGEAEQAYAVSLSVLAWMEREHGEDAPARIVREVKSGASWDDALVRVLGMNSSQMEEAWRGSAELRYRWIPIVTSSGAVWMVILALLFVAGARRRARRLELERLWGERSDWEAEPVPVGAGGNGHDGEGGGGNGHAAKGGGSGPDRWIN